MAEIIDGRSTAKKVNKETAVKVEELKNKHGVVPGLAVVIVGEDPASKVYVNMKVKKCTQLGIHSDKRVLPEDASQEDVLAVVDELNNNDKIHGILVQSPPPPQINEAAIVDAIDPDKDVDCFHARNVGKMLLGEKDGFEPCTPAGIMQLLKRYKIDPEGKHAVIIGRSSIVGKPMMSLLVQKAEGANATVTVCHSRTQNMPELIRQGDIVIAAIGKPEFLTADMVKDGALVIDVGINRVDAPEREKGYKLVGDVAYNEVSEKASYITPVPGGVGPMTIAMLLRNAVKACKMLNGIA